MLSIKELEIDGDLRFRYLYNYAFHNTQHYLTIDEIHDINLIKITNAVCNSASDKF